MSDKAHNFLNYASFYAQMLPILRERAKACGYALAIHGSMGRDLDIVAVPWIEAAVSEEELVKAIAEVAGCFVPTDHVRESGVIYSNPALKPHGRRAWTVSWGGHAYIDLSVMARQVG